MPTTKEMQVELTTDRVTARIYYAAGTVITVSVGEGKRLIKSGSAIPARSTPVETTSRRGRPRKIA